MFLGLCIGAVVGGSLSFVLLATIVNQSNAYEKGVEDGYERGYQAAQK